MRFDYERHNDNEYVVKKGDSLYTIAKKYNVSVDDLLKVNGLTSALIYPNQVLIIPLTNNGNVYFMEYVVKENDSLNLIADKYNVNINELKNYNNFEKLYLATDQVIYIPVKSKTHKVEVDDTIDIIIKKYDMTLEEFVHLNKEKLLIVGSYLNVK